MQLQNLPWLLALFGRRLGLAFSYWLDSTYKTVPPPVPKFNLSLNNKNSAEIIQTFIAYKTRTQVMEYQILARATKRLPKQSYREIDQEMFSARILPDW